MTTVVSVAQGGTGSNSAALARTALGVPPSAAYDQANTARDQANTARTQANTGYDQANTARGQANTAYAQANAAYGQANSAYGQANAAYGAANTRLSASGGTLSGDLIITGNLTVSGNSTTLNAEILTVEDADVVLLSNVASTPALNAGIIVNRGTSTNTFIRWAENIDEWGWSDNGTTTYFFEDLRQGLITTNTTFGTVNTNITNTNSNAINAYAQANAAYGAANNRVLKAGDTMTGQLNISSGGLLVTGNVGFGTASPSRRLHLSSSGTDCGIRIDNTVSGRPALLLYDDSQNLTITNSSDTGYIGFINGTGAGTERVRIANTGNVGIGTTAPYSSLHLAGDLTMGSGSNARPALKITNWGYSASYRALMIGSPNTLYTTANTGAVTVCFNYDPSVNPNSSFSGDGREIIFRRGTRFVTPNSADNAFNLTNLVLYDGCVGIGLDAPETQLHIAKSSSGGLGPQLVLDNTAGSALNNAVEISFLTDNGASPVGTRNARIRAVNENVGDGAARLEFYTWNGGTDAERMRISSGGNVGIGTSPQALLHLGSAAVNTSGDIDTSHTKLIIKQTSNSNKGGIYLERTAERKGYYVWINPSAGSGDGLSFTRNNNGTVSDVMHLDRDGKAIFRGGVILNNIIRTWAVGQPANFITTTATNCFTIKINRTGSPSNYFAGIIFDVYMMGGYDWSGNGFTTYFAKMMVTFFSTDTARAHIIQEYGRSYVNNSGTEILYNSITTSTDANYIYITFRYVGVNASAGYKPNICVITYDNNSNGGDTTIINDVYSA